MAKEKKTDSNWDGQIQFIFKSERKTLKEKLDNLWNDSPAEAKPILEEMQELIAITEEYSKVKDDLQKTANIIETITKDKDHLVKSLLCLLNSINEWRDLKSQDISCSLRSFIKINSEDSPVRKAVLFESDKLLNTLADAANRIDAVVNKNNKPQGSHMSGDDSEYMLFESKNENELAFSEVFKK